MNAKKVAPILLIAVLAAIAIAVMIKASIDGNQPKQPSGAATQEQTGQKTKREQQPQQEDQRKAQQPATQAVPDTLVPEGMSPDEFVKKYYDAVVKKDYQTAYEMQPASKKASAGLDTFKSTQESYGISSFAVNAVEVQGDSATVKASLNLGQYGTWTSIWQFSKKNGRWIAESSRTGMAQ